MDQGMGKPKNELESKIIAFRPRREKRERRTCNLCKSTFAARSHYDRFCPACKDHNELYHFHEWLPAS